MLTIPDCRRRHTDQIHVTGSIHVYAMQIAEELQTPK